MFARCVAGLAAGLFLAPALLAQADTAGASTAEYIRLAREGAPEPIAVNAAVARMQDGQLVELEPGTNGFTCLLLPDPGNPPVCGDQNATKFLVAALTGKPKPDITAPGIAYMAQGGSHYATPGGVAVMQPGPDTKLVKEPPHWMLLWPFDSTSGITADDDAQTYIMWEGTPYAHLMIHQDPERVVRQPN